MTTRSTDSPPVAPAGTTDTTASRQRDLPVRVFQGVVLLVVGFVLSGPGGVADLLAATPWGPARDSGAGLHRWHAIDLAGHLSLLTVGTLAIAARRPRAAGAIVQTLIASLAGFALVALAMPAPSEVLIPVVVIVVLLVSSFPQRRDLVRLPTVERHTRASLLAAAIPAPFLVANLWQNLDRQLGGTDPHALLGHWAGGAGLALALLVTAGAVAVVPAARRLAPVMAITLGYLGAAALVHSSHDGAWPAWGAVLALAAAALFLDVARTGDPSDADVTARPTRRTRA